MSVDNSQSIYAVISRLREKIRQSSDDSVYSDQYLYDILLDYRNVLYAQELNKRNRINKWMYKFVCMPLEEVSESPCECLPHISECKVLKSKYKVPAPLRSILRDMFYVLTVDLRNEIPEGDRSRSEIRRSRRIGSTYFYEIVNEYLYIVGYPQNRLPAIVIKLIPADPASLSNITLCLSDGTTTNQTCYDPLTDTFNIDDKLVGVMIDMAFESITNSAKMPEDRSNDAESVVPTNKI